MKNKKLLTILGVTTLLVGGMFVNQGTRPVDAANTDNSKEKWSAIGTINSSSWNKDFPLTYDEVDDRYELTIALSVGNEFKIRLNNAWTTSIGYGGHTGAGISTYLSNSGGNFKVKTAGNYILWVKDDNVRNYGDKSYGFGIEKAPEVKYYTVTHHKKDGTVLKEEEVIEKSTYNPAFEEIEGYRLEGWYTDSNLTNKIEKGTSITSDLKLYPKYVEATDYTIYFEDEKAVLGSKASVYLWSDSFDGHTNAAWPGEALSKDNNGKYYVEVDASKSFDHIIFTDGNSDSTIKTDDLSLVGLLDKDTYVLGSKNTTTGNYSASVSLTSLTNLFSTYYNEGSYVKETELNVNTATMGEIEQYFHAGAQVRHRKTTYTPGQLTMVTKDTAEEDWGTRTSTYKDNGTGVDHLTNGTKDYSVSGGNRTSVESWFITLDDFKSAATAGWTYSNGIYTYALQNADKTVTAAQEAMKELAREFVAPMWLNTDAAANYVKFDKLTVEEVAGKLVMKLHVDSGNSGQLIDATELVFSTATITK